MVASGNPAVVVFVSLVGVHPVFEAAALDRQTVDQLGKPLWDMNKSLGLDSQTLVSLLDLIFKSQSTA